MDNVILDNNEYSDSSSEESDEMHYEMYSDNIGVVHETNINNDGRLLDMTLEKDYNITRNKYFTPEILKTRLLIDTNSIKRDNINTSEYTIYFKNTNDDDNEKGGYDHYQNVIGLKLTRAMIYNAQHVVNTTNNKFTIEIENIDTYNIDLIPGAYTLYTFREHIEERLNTLTVQGMWEFILDEVSYKYKIKNTQNRFKLLWGNDVSEAYRLFGAQKVNTEFININHEYTFDKLPQHNNTYVDVVIDEIPYIACKKNGKKLNIIDRVPMINNNSELVHYEPRVDNYNIYFHPINISQLTIKLYDESGNLYPNNNNNNSFEFEITELKHINQ